MKFFCLQPDIVEDAPSVRYKTKSAHSSRSSKDHHGGVSGLFLPMTTKHTVNHHSNGANATINRSRSSIGAHAAPATAGPATVGVVGAGAAGMRTNGQRKHSSIGGTGIGQAFAPAVSAPILHSHQQYPQPYAQPSYPHPPPASAPPTTVYVGPSSSSSSNHGHSVRSPAITNDPKAAGHHVTSAMMMVAGNGAITDSDRELSGPGAFRRKSRRMSAPLVSLGLANSTSGGMESGNESSREKKSKRVSKLVIGAPEGFRHEGHIGVGEAFMMLQGASMGNGGAVPLANGDVPGDGGNRPRTHEGRQTDRPPSVHESSSPRTVEAWRAEIEHTRKPSNGSHVATAPPVPRPKGPRPTSTSPPSVDVKNSLSTRTRKRSSADGSIARPSIDRPSIDRPSIDRQSEREGEQDDGASTEPPTSNRPGVLHPAGRVSPPNAPTSYGQRSGSRSRSRSGSEQPGSASTQQQRHHQTATTTGVAPTHLPGQDSISSLASTTFSNPTSQSSHATTGTGASLSRSHSEKPYYHPSQQQMQSPLQQYYQQQQQQPPPQQPRHNPQSSSYGGSGSSRGGGGGGGWNSHHLQDVSASSSLQRSASANAAVRPTLAPSSTSSTATAASVASSSATLTGPPGAMMSTISVSTRKPIPTPRRKPVPPPLPATIEVSPFPSIFVENSTNNIGKPNQHELIPDLPLDLQRKISASKAAAAALRAEEGSIAMDSGAETDRTTRTMIPPGVTVRRELVPLLGVPNDGARYVTKSTKVRYDGVMAEIANALREPEATPTT